MESTPNSVAPLTLEQKITKLLDFYNKFPEGSDEKQLVQLVLYYGTNFNKEESIKQLQNALFNTLAGGQFNVHKNYLFYSPRIVNQIFALLPFLGEISQLELLDTFIVILEECTVDCALCSDVGLIEKILSMIKRQDELYLSISIVQKLLYIIGILGSHNITARELKGLMKFIRNKEGELHQELSPLILEIIRKMTRSESPSSYFNFDGKECGMVTDNLHFPTGGYSISAWIRLEKATNSINSRFYAIFDKQSNGIEVFFKGNHIGMQVANSNKKGYTANMNFFFHTNRWYFICITHYKKLLGSSEVTLYVDGEHKQTHDLKYPSLSTRVGFAHFGTNVPFGSAQSNAHIASFCGQCGPIVLIDKVITPQEIEKLYKMGPDFQFVFRKGDLPPNFPDFEQFATRVSLVYNPRACTRNRICLDNALWKKNWDSNAKLLQGTCVLISRKVRDTLNCIGGVRITFPLFKLLHSEWEVEYSMSARITSLLSEMLRNSPTNQEVMLQTNAFCVLGFVLASLPPKYINHDTLKALQGLIECSPNPEDPLMREVYKNIFANYQLWIRVDAEVQKDMHLFMREQIAKHPAFFHQHIGTQYLLDILRYFYWYTVEQDAENSYQPKERPGLEDLKLIRLNIFEMIKLMVKQGISEEEVQAILRHLLDSPDELQVIEGLRWLLVLIDDEVPHLVEHLGDDKFIYPFLTLLHRSTKELRLFALKVVGKILDKGTAERRSRFEAGGGCLIIEHTLVAHNFDAETYTGIMEVLLNVVTYKIHNKLQCDLANCKISLPNLLSPFFHMLCDQDAPVREAAIADFNVLLKANQENVKIFVKNTGWQNWLLQLIVPKETEAKQSRTLTELVMDTMSVVLAEAMSQREGYKQVKDAITYIDILTERKDVETAPVYNAFFNSFLPFVVGGINKFDMVKEHPFWENLYHVVVFVEEYMMLKKSEVLSEFAEQLNIIKYLTLGFDFLIKKSVKDMKAMEVLHTDSYKEKRGFSIQTIISMATEMTSTAKHAIPHQNLFLLLFRLELFLLENLEPKEIQDSKYIIRLMALLCMDIDHSRVPKPTWKGEVVDADATNQRVLYIFAKLVLEMNEDRFYLIPVAKALVRKYKPLFASIFASQEAKEFWTKPLSCLDQEAEAEEFILSFKSEWDCVKESEPFATVMRDAIQEQGELRRGYQLKKEKHINKVVQDIEKAMSNDIALLKKANAESLKAKQQLCFEELQRLNNWRHNLRRQKLITMNEWKKSEEGMFTDIGVWAPEEGPNAFKFYKLDFTENSLRMRTRLISNPQGTQHKEASIHSENKEHSEKEEGGEAGAEDDTLTSSELASSLLHNAVKKEEQKDDDTEGDDTDDDEEKPKEDKEEGWESIAKSAFDEDLSRTTEEKTVLIVPCELVMLLNPIKGTFEITNKHIYYITDKEVKEGQYDQKWPLADLRQMFKRRYLLRYTAIEIFFANKTTCFFNFDKKDLDNVISTIVSLRPPLLHYHNGNPAQLLKKSKLTQQWIRREISNFEYLMALNTYANRTYNDLTQYPVFPWILKDYESSTIDLADPNIYRDLSKPVGALNPQRLEQAIERFNSFVDPVIPKFHYGSHYSSVGTVLYYLIRMEPFTEYNIKMQGGSFDLPDRLFHSINTTFNNCLTSLADVKELIPEFFYNPEFLKNMNRLDLGKKQSGERLADTVLPPWAKTPEEFIRINREALESEYVSQHLHEWIDLIFGYKQIGKEAEKAYNVFYYLTYEGSVNIDEIEDPVFKKSIETQISNFGQTPTQLFKKAHPKRNPKAKFDKPSYWKTDLFKPFNVIQVMENNSPIIYVDYVESADKLMVINNERELVTYNWMKSKPSQPISTPIGLPMATDIYVNSLCFAASRDGKWIFSTGHFDKSIKVSSIYDKLQVKQSQFDHKDVVCCIQLSEDGTYLVSGSKDATVAVWEVQTKSSSKGLSQKPKVTLYGHEQPVLTVDVNSDLDTVASGDSDGQCIIHSILEGRYIRTITYPGRQQIDIVKIAPLSGHILMHSTRDGLLHVFTINGTRLASVNTFDQLKSIVITKDSKYVITGGRNKQIVVRRLYDLEEVHTFEMLSADIRCLAIKGDNNLIVGLGNGRVVFYALDPELLETKSKAKDIVLEGKRKSSATPIYIPSNSRSPSRASFSATSSPLPPSQ